MAEGAGQPADSKAQPTNSIHRNDFGGGIVIAATAILAPILLLLFGSGFSDVLAAANYAKAANGAMYALPLLVFAVPAFGGFVRNPQDYYGGVALVAFSLFALWASNDLPGMRGFAFGPGTAPRLFSWLLVATGAGVAINGLFVAGPPLEKWGIRAPVLFIASVVFFGATVRPLGLIISAFFTLMIASMATREVRWIEAAIWSAALTAFCVGLFVYGLNLPLQLWPR